MNRATKIKKLSNAIRAYTGTRHGLNGPFVIHPQPDKKNRIRELLYDLGLNKDEVSNALTKIDGFKTYDQFHAWLKTPPIDLCTTPTS